VRALQEGGGVPQEQAGSPGLGELSQSDLTGLVAGLDEEDEDIFKQLGDPAFELENFFTVFDEKEENNNNVVHSCAGTGNVSASKSALMQELRCSAAAMRKNIAAANPLLAGQYLG
jgi:hypothetical protein